MFKKTETSKSCTYVQLLVHLNLILSNQHVFVRDLRSQLSGPLLITLIVNQLLISFEAIDH